MTGVSLCASTTLLIPCAYGSMIIIFPSTPPVASIDSFSEISKLTMSVCSSSDLYSLVDEKVCRKKNGSKNFTVPLKAVATKPMSRTYLIRVIYIPSARFFFSFSLRLYTGWPWSCFVTPYYFLFYSASYFSSFDVLLMFLKSNA